MTNDLLEIDISLEEMYDDIIADENLHEPAINGNEAFFIGASYNNSLFLIETFVREIANDQQPAFKWSRGTLERRPLAKYLETFDSLTVEYSERKVFSPQVSLFFDSAQRLGMMNVAMNVKSHDFHMECNRWAIDLFNALVEDIRARVQSREFKKEVRSREYGCVRNYRSTRKYVHALFEKYSRLLVLRVDLSFKSRQLCADGPVTVGAAQKHLERFLNARRSNRVFKDLVGYVWKLEFGNLKGFHYHCIFFLRGSDARKDEFRASEIGKYWIKVTEGVGCYHNVNAKKRNYERFGIGVGMIDHTDVEMRENLMRIVGYFFKKEQFLSEKFKKKTRVFGRGEMPSPRTSNAGRPRREIDVLRLTRSSNGLFNSMPFSSSLPGR
jgi:hypothetical protein